MKIVFVKDDGAEVEFTTKEAAVFYKELHELFSVDVDIKTLQPSTPQPSMPVSTPWSPAYPLGPCTTISINENTQNDVSFLSTCSHSCMISS